MSNRRDRLEEDEELERAVDLVSRYYHLVLGALLLGFMLWNRVRPWDNFVVDGEVLFNGNDAWYHFRSTAYTVRNWPQTMPFDPWTYFPVGNHSGQFGTLLDQLLATLALIVGLGSPSDHTIRLVVLFAPAIFGVLAGIPAYFIGRRLGGRLGGVTALTVLALSSGAFLQRSMVGFSDHHIAEALFQTLAILGMMVAVTVARREKPVYEQFIDRDVDGLRRTIVWSVLAGVAISLYLWVWPFGVLLFGILGTYFLVQLLIEFMRGDSPEHTAIVGAIALGVTGVLMLIPITSSGFVVSDFSLLHPVLAFAVAAGCVFMAWLARRFDETDVAPVFYPVSVLSTLVVGTLLVWVVTPAIFDLFANNLVRIFGGVVGIDPSSQAGTVGEIRAMSQPATYLFQVHGFAAFIALLGGAVIVFRNLLGNRLPPQRLLVVVWGLFVFAASLTQVRFAYYLAFPIATLTAYVVGQSLAQLKPNGDDFVLMDGDGINVEGYQILAVVAIVLLVVAPMTAVAAPTNIERYDSPGQDIQSWTNGLDWMAENTPEEGTLGGASNELDYYGTYKNVDDFDYKSGQYGVLSWWDYGHWITAQGERIPNANPFQQGATNAANFLLAPNETQAGNVLDEMDEDDAGTRYVAVDWMMAESNSDVGGKFFAPPNFYSVDNVSRSDYYNRVYSGSAQSLRGPSLMVQRQSYYESMTARLYLYHGSAVEPQPIVLDWGIGTLQGESVRQTTSRRALLFNRTMSGAQSYVANDTTSAVGGIGGLPSERVPALEHYRLVGTSEQSATESSNYNRGILTDAQISGLGYEVVNSTSQCGTDVTARTTSGQVACLPEQTSDQVFHPTSPQWLKLFERVPGGTIEGTGPANSTVFTTVEMYNPASNDTFEYTQRAQTNDNGEFEMIVPYSTTGYDEYGPENGYTNVSVRANGSYQFAAQTFQNGTLTTWNGSADVSEGAVLGVEDTTVTVDMQIANSRDIFGQNETNESNTTVDTDSESTDDSSTTTATPTDTDDSSTTATPTDTSTDAAAETSTATPTETAN